MKSNLQITLLISLSLAGCNLQDEPIDNTTNEAKTENSLQPDPIVLTSKESDPANFDWMQGFPPPKEKRLRVSDGSFFSFPALRYSVVHMREFFPTINVSRGLGAPHPFQYALDESIDTISFYPWGSDEKMTWETSLDKNYTDGVIILHRGKVVYERYFAELDENKVHAVMSVTKSFTGLLAAILVAESSIDENANVSSILPELEGSGFADATVRQVMDMTTGIKFNENYADPKAEIWSYGAAGNPMLNPETYAGPVGYFEYLKTIKKEGPHGDAFGYKTVNSDVLGWILSRVTGKKISQLLSERIWSKLGMEQDAYYQIDVLGTPFAGGGLNAGLRDLARFGELIRNKGIWKDNALFPQQVVKDIEKGGDKTVFAKSGYSSLKGWSYRNMWWISHNEHGAYAARGVHGQTIYIDPVAEMVIVRLASHPTAGNAAIDPTSLPAYHAVARYLLSWYSSDDLKSSDEQGD
jgi:hypothetical protein